MSRNSAISSSKRFRSSGRTRTRFAAAATSRAMMGDGSKSDVDLVGERVDGLPVTLRLDARRVVGPGVSHHEDRRRVETLDQEPRFLVDRQAERAADAPHPLLAQPLLRGSEERGERVRAIFRIEHPEEAGGIGIALEVQRVDLRADPPDGLAPAPGDPRLPSRVLEVGIAAWATDGGAARAAAAGPRPDRIRKSRTGRG